MSKDNYGVSHLANMPITVTYALVILIALALCILLRHLFGSIRVEAGTR